MKIRRGLTDKKLDKYRRTGKSSLDYVIRRFNASSAGLKKPVGLDLRWDRRLRDFQIQLEPRVSRSEAACSKRLARMVPDSPRNWIAVNAVQQVNLNKRGDTNMRSRFRMLLSAITFFAVLALLFAALALTLRLAAQDKQDNNPRHHHYMLINLGT